jgi:hypothetical protein
MPITNPASCRDHAEDWFGYFYARRGAEICEMITPDLIAEHRNNADQSHGPHSSDLHLVLNYLRAAPIIGKEFVCVVKPHEQYRVGIVTARGTAPDMLNEQCYSSEQEGVHAVFMARVDKLRSALNHNEGTR